MDFTEIYKHDIFANQTGAVLDSLGDEGSKMHLEVEAHHLNGGKVVHGGVVFLLADITMAAIANYNRALSFSIQSDIRFLASATQGDTLFAHGEVTFSRKSSANCRVTITNQRDEVIALAEGMFLSK